MVKIRDRSARRQKRRKRRSSSPASPAGTTPAGQTRQDISPATARNPASATDSCAGFLAKQPAAHPSRADIDAEDGGDYGHQDRTDIRIVEFSDCDHELLPDAASTD